MPIQPFCGFRVLKVDINKIGTSIESSLRKNTPIKAVITSNVFDTFGNIY